LDGVARPCPPYNLSVVPAGRVPSGSYEILKSPRLAELFRQARDQYDYVIVDTPPLMPFPDCQLIGSVVDGFLVVVQAHRTPRKHLNDSLGVLEQDRIIGLIFNGDDGALHAYGYDYSPSASSNGHRRTGGNPLGQMARRVGGSLRGRFGRFRSEAPIDE